MDAARRHAGAIGALRLLISDGTLVAAFLSSVDSASFHLRRAAIAQAQFAAMLRIHGRIAARAPDRAALEVALRDYAGLVARETVLLPADDRVGQRAEALEAATIARLAGRPDAPVHVTRLVSAMIDRERDEAAEATRTMEALRRRTGWIAALLGIVAGGSALLGAAGLMSANRRLNRQVAARTTEFIAIDASRRLFFAKASHELRTPVTVMRGEAEVTLADPAAPPAALRAALRHVVAQADFLGHRLTELLGLAQAEQGRILLAQTAFDLADAVSAARDATAGFARSLDVAVAIHVVAAPVIGDRRWIEQAIIAVLDNAIKFSPTGDRVTVALAATADVAMLAITDRGAGVAEAALPRVFDAYYQTDAARARRQRSRPRTRPLGGRAAWRQRRRGQSGGRWLHRHAAVSAGGPSMNILLVEDDPGIGRFVARVLPRAATPSRGSGRVSVWPSWSRRVRSSPRSSTWPARWRRARSVQGSAMRAVSPADTHTDRARCVAGPARRVRGGGRRLSAETLRVRRADRTARGDRPPRRTRHRRAAALRYARARPARPFGAELSVPVVLSRREFDLLAALMAGGGALVARDALARAVWGEHAAVSDNALDVYIGYVRRRLAEVPDAPAVETARGRGFHLASRPPGVSSQGPSRS